MFHGNEGHGKGTFVKVLTKIFGDNVSPTVAHNQVQSDFNSYLKNKLFIILEEAVGYSNKNGTMSLLKDIITNDTVFINEKNKQPYFHNNLASAIFFSNEVDPVTLSSSDRRFVVHKTHKAINTLGFLQNDLDTEAKAFAFELKNWDLTPITVISTDAKEELISLTKNPVELVY